MSKEQRNPEDVGVISTSQQIADLQQSLSSHKSPIGDWKGIKYREAIDAGRPAPYTAEVMKDYYDKREAVRKQINVLEAQLKEERAGNGSGTVSG